MKCLIIVDMVRGFVEKGALLLPKAKELIPKINNVIAHLDEDDIIIHMNDTHEQHDKEFDMFPPHCIIDTEECEVADGFEYGGRDVLKLPKTRFSAFYNPLTMSIKTLQNQLACRRIDRLIIVGVCTEICILFTVADARFRDYRVSVVRDCVSGITKKGHEWALNHMVAVMGVEVVKYANAKNRNICEV